MGASHMDASHMGSSHMGAGEHGGVLPEGPERAVPFEETYRGRRLRGGPVRDAAGRSTDEGAWEITVDGRPLHLMRRADGTWLSMVDHYTSHPTPLGATRAAVDELGPGRRLRDLMSGPAGHRHGTPDTGGTAATGTGMTNGMGADSGVRT
ncbi:tyrosinase cofactor [Streptomyces sp. J2-1]|nr:tyrosinase cofactor [Streptomyces corallincola]MBV2357481.1 tyrosinase cofactor [Streptomyces corallincola]